MGLMKAWMAFQRSGRTVAGLNRNTNNPHEHRMEKARRTTRPGTPERRTAERMARGLSA
jgi:hypothetical protein